MPNEASARPEDGGFAVLPLAVALCLAMIALTWGFVAAVAALAPTP